MGVCWHLLRPEAMAVLALLGSPSLSPWHHHQAERLSPSRLGTWLLLAPSPEGGPTGLGKVHEQMVPPEPHELGRPLAALPASPRPGLEQPVPPLPPPGWPEQRLMQSPR